MPSRTRRSLPPRRWRAGARCVKWTRWERSPRGSAVQDAAKRRAYRTGNCDGSRESSLGAPERSPREGGARTASCPGFLVASAVRRVVVGLCHDEREVSDADRLDACPDDGSCGKRGEGGRKICERRHDLAPCQLKEHDEQHEDEAQNER